MDSDPYSTQTFITSKKIKPYISYEENNEIKSFDVISMIDDSESIVFSSANFDSNYNLLYGEVNALSFASDRYNAIKNLIDTDISLSDLVNVELNPEAVSILKTSALEAKFLIDSDDRMIELPYSYQFLNEIVLDDLMVRGEADQINDYLMKVAAGKKCSTKVFENIERKYAMFKVITTQKKQKVKSA